MVPRASPWKTTSPARADRFADAELFLATQRSANGDACDTANNRTEEANVHGNVRVDYLASITSVKALQDLAAMATSVSIPANATAGGKDFSFTNLNLASGLDPASPFGNFFSLLAGTGATTLAGPALAGLMTGGFPG